MSPKYQKAFRFSVYGMGVLATVLEVISPILKLGFYIDENLKIHNNYYSDVFRYFYIYFAVTIAIMLLGYRKKFIARTFRCICVVMATAIGLMCFQEGCMETSYTTVTFAIPIIAILFLFHYNSYDLNTGTMDQYAFQQYVEDLSDKKKKFSLIFLSFPTISDKGLNKFSQDLLRRNDNFYKDSCCFRLGDKRVVLVFQKEKNPDFVDRNWVLYGEFTKVCGNNDYYIVAMDSDKEFVKSNDYIEFCEYVESHISINSYKICDLELLNEFKKVKYIHSNLRDIYEKDDLDDPRVKVFCQPV